MVISVPVLESNDGLIVRTDAPPFQWVVADPEPPKRQARRLHPVPAESRHTYQARFDREAHNRHLPLRAAAKGTITIQPALRRGVIEWPETMTLRPGGLGARCDTWHEARARYAAANDWKLGV